MSNIVESYATHASALGAWVQLLKHTSTLTSMTPSSSVLLLLLYFSATAFALICVWLAFTLSDQKRPRRAGCSSYTCDLAWDIILAVFWFAMLIVAAVNKILTGSILSACLFVLFVSSAAIAGKIRGDFRRNGGLSAAPDAPKWQTPILGAAV
jgi:hypothetical protein